MKTRGKIFQAEGTAKSKALEAKNKPGSLVYIKKTRHVVGQSGGKNER